MRDMNMFNGTYYHLEHRCFNYDEIFHTYYNARDINI